MAIAPESEAAAIPEDLNLVKDIFKTFTKTMKAFTVYPRDNPIYRRFSDELTDRFGAFFRLHEALDLDVAQYSLKYGGHDVFVSEDRQANIALMLYVDGIRQISFYEGLAAGEMEEFINILRTVPSEDNLEDDVVTLLWEKDLEHIGYFVPEEVGEDEASIEEALASMEMPEASDGAAGGGTGGSGVVKGRAFSQGAFHLGLKTAPLRPELLDSLKQEAFLLEGEELLAAAVEFFIDRMSGEKDIAVYAEYAKQLARLFDFRLENKDVRRAVEILKKLKEFLGPVTEPSMRQPIEDVITAAGSYEKFAAVLKITDDLNLIGDYIAQLNSSSASDMIRVLGETENRNIRRMLFNTLALFVRDNVEPFAKALRDGRWHIVSNVVMIMGMSAEPAMVAHIKKTLQHPEFKVRREAARALSVLQSPESRKLLMELLSDPDAGVRNIALKSLRRHGDEELYVLVLEHIEKSGFGDKGFEEKKEMLETLGETGRERALPVLSALFRKKSLFHKEKNYEMRAAAAHGLAYVEGPEAAALLKTGLESKSSLLRSACSSALKRKTAHEKA